MATDEAILRENQRPESLPTLRMYRWSPPAVSVGYFQKVENEIDLEVCARRGIDVVRRPTGGKAVLHGNDLTYAVAAKITNPLFPRDILGTYRVISECIVDCLLEYGIESEMVESGRLRCEAPLEASCFAMPSRYELLVKKRKICGSAQMRIRGVFLQHGSIVLKFDPVSTCDVLRVPFENRSMYIEKLRDSVTSVSEEIGSDVDVDVLCRRLRKSFEKRLGIDFVEGEMTEEEKNLKHILLQEKYMNPKWNRESRG